MPIHKTHWILILLLALPLTGAAETLGILHLKGSLSCRGNEIRLGTIFEEGEAVPFADKVIAKAPSPGKSREISSARLQRRLWDWGWRGQISGAESLTLETPALKLATGPLTGAVESKLNSLLEAEGLRRAGEIKGWPETLTLSDFQVRWDLQLRGKREFRNRSAGLVVTDSRGFEERVVLRFHCEMPVTVAVATADMKAGEAVGQWSLQERDGFFVDGEAVGPDELEGALCSRDINLGTTLSDRNVSTGILVHAGREVEIKLARGAVTIAMRGIAQNDGALGDRVNVRHMDSQELRRYRVTGHGRVAPLYQESEGEAS